MIIVHEEETKPIPGYPGYHIAKSGNVYSTKRLSATPLKTQRNGKWIVVLIGKARTNMSIEKALDRVWGMKLNQVELPTPVIQPKRNWLPQDKNGKFIIERSIE